MANIVETINDWTLLALTYMLWCFTDMVGEPETRYDIGYAYIIMSLANIVLQLITMIYESSMRVKLSCKRCINRRKASKLPKVSKNKAL